MSKTIFFLLSLMMVTYVQCKVNTEPASDRSTDKERPTGTLMTVDDCFSLYVLQGQIAFDGSELSLGKFNAIDGECTPNSKDDDLTLQKASITFDTETSNTELGNIKLKIETSYNPRTQYWAISEISVNQPGLADSKAIHLEIDSNLHTAAHNYSFSCMNLVLNRKAQEGADEKLNKISKIILQDFQLQPFKGEIFLASFNCTTWFTIGTFCGLLVLILFTSILAFGILYIMNIKTNDRFEDPKGKPLQLGNTDN